MDSQKCAFDSVDMTGHDDEEGEGEEEEEEGAVVDQAGAFPEAPAEGNAEASAEPGELVGERLNKKRPLDEGSLLPGTRPRGEAGAKFSSPFKYMLKVSIVLFAVQVHVESEHGLSSLRRSSTC